MNYLLDSNAYIQAKNFYYRMSICPGFWGWLDCNFQNGRVGSIDMVYDELVHAGDDLSSWVKQRKAVFMAVDDEATQSNFGEIAQFIVEHKTMREPHVSNFLSVADPWLIAKAKTIGATLVTQEVLVPDNSTKVKIPNICREFGVSYCNTFDLLETLKAQLIFPG
ncbi:DUF4411 family protein [Chromobacterium vaccinii]|uniref:DUF4411 family protein n=1 Tax=Chromobacterium vaccinii TaxID=1108595 RepID=UPI0009E1B6ED|nr:DUF4411 family protein [Chromobacterium vaccinii]